MMYIGQLQTPRMDSGYTNFSLRQSCDGIPHLSIDPVT